MVNSGEFGDLLGGMAASSQSPAASRGRWAFSLGLVVGLSFGVGALASPAFRTSARAAYRAFRDPSLVAPRDAQPAPAGAALPVDESPSALSGRYVEDLSPLKEAELDLETLEGESLRSLAMPDFGVPLTRRTLRYVEWLTKKEAGRRAFLERYRRAGKYRVIVGRALREAGLPEDLAWVAAIESGFDPGATSPAGAVGLFQMMPETGAVYGLDRSPLHDERRNVVRSSAAAAAHLRDLYERFHRWDLALAAYNAGFDRVLGALEKVAARRAGEGPLARPLDFADLAASAALPRETLAYVPQVTAFALVAANRARFGLDSADLAVQPPLDPAEIAVPPGTRLGVVAKAAGVSLDVLRDYNPQLLRDRVPTLGGDYVLYVPADRVQRTLATFVSYQEADVVARVDEADDDISPVDGEETLPARPRFLGKNRLPRFEVPGQRSPDRRVLADLDVVRVLGQRLPTVGVEKAIGYQQTFLSADDPLGLVSGSSVLGAHERVSARTTDGAAIERALGLGAPQKVAPAQASFELPSGVSVRVVKDREAPDVQITVRLGSGHGADSRWLTGAVPRPAASDGRDHDVGGARFGTGEVVHTLSVAKSDVELGLGVAAGRLRLLLTEGSDAELAALRATLFAPRKKLLSQDARGAATVALYEALFPPGHPLSGALPGRREDAAFARDAWLVDALAAERRPREASITIVGDVAEERVRRALLASLPALSNDQLFGARAPLTARVGEVRVTREGPARLVVGHALAGLSLRERASLLFALEVLGGAKGSRLEAALVRAECAAPAGPTAPAGPPLGAAACERLAEAAEAGLEELGRASVASIELTLAPGKRPDDALRAYDTALDAFVREGPTQREVGVAHFWLRHRLERELGKAKGKAPKNVEPTFFAARLAELVSPGEGDLLLAELGKVSLREVQAAARKHLGRERRAVVLVSPAP
jgi:membrane-bound lytic murein transglycosylase D